MLVDSDEGEKPDGKEGERDAQHHEYRLAPATQWLARLARGSDRLGRVNPGFLGSSHGS